MSSELAIEVREYLKRCGLPQRKIDQCDYATRMYHDLGIYGDVAEAYMETLVDRYGVDLSDFKFHEFFPPEFEGKNAVTGAIISLIPFANYMFRNSREYSPLTLNQLYEAMRKKGWK